MSNLKDLYLGGNVLSGSIAFEIFNISTLENIELQDNGLSGDLPHDICGRLPKLKILSLASNRLSGPLPSAWSQCLQLQGIYLSGNSFSGLMPKELFNLKALEDLHLEMNNLQGIIPEEIGNLTKLRKLTLYDNNLTGVIPKEIENLTTLMVLDLRFNQLRGAIPLEMGNLYNLEEIYLENGIHHILILSFSISGFIVAVAVGIVCLIYWKKDTASVKKELPTLARTKRISYYELQQATQGYDERNLLGQGSFGSVYKGTLRDGQVIAVKVFNLRIERALKSFDVECEVLRNLHHRNLTPVISSCSNEDFRALVLEFMPNGNLENWLHSENCFLNLMERLSIMIDVACALQYLHSGYSVPVVHSDLKPSNVLVDGDMIGHVSDFGIAKILVEESMEYTNTPATFGYIAPEYGSEGLVSTKCDVYSYGIMLMEVLTSKRPDDEMFDENLTLKDWVNRAMETALPEVIDDGLIQSVEEAHLPVILECLSTIMHVALNCAKVVPKERSDIREVLESLNKIKLKLSKFY